MSTPRVLQFFTSATTRVLILLSLGCGNEPIEDIRDTSPPPGRIDAPSTIYFPMSVGNRWVYRNPDGSEWSRLVAESEVFDAERYHSFSYEPPIKLDSLASVEYLTYADRFVRRMNLSELNDIVSEIILESSEGLGSWGFGLSCNTRRLQKPVCETDKNARRPRIMTLLYFTGTEAVWHSDFVLLQYPVFPSQIYTALDFRLKGAEDFGGYYYDVKAKLRIQGRTGDDWESVDTPAGRFEKCLKIQYEQELKLFDIVDFRVADGHDDIFLDAAREVYQSEILEELNDLLPDLVPKLGLQTMWLAPGVGPVKIETLDGYTELIDYQIVPAR